MGGAVEVSPFDRAKATRAEKIAKVQEGVAAAAEAGCEQIVFFESTPLQWNNTWDAAYKAIKQFGV